MFIFVAGTIALTLGLAVVTTQTAFLLRQGPLPFNPLLNWSENSARLVLVALCLLLIRAGQVYVGLTPETFGLVPLDVGRDVGLGLLIGLLVPLVINLISVLALRHGASAFFSKNAILSMRPQNPQELGMISLTILPAAMVEELLFRSLLVGGMAAALGLPPTLTVVISSMTFGLMHLAQGLWGVVITFLVGLLFGELFVSTGSFWLPLVAHWAMNVFQFTLAYLRPDLIQVDE